MLRYTCTACLVRYTNIHYHSHGSPPLVLILSNMTRVHLIPSYYPNIHSNIVPPYKPISSKLYPSLRFSSQNAANISLLLHACCILRSSHPFWFGKGTNHEESRQAIFPASRYFLSLRSKYLPSICGSSIPQTGHTTHRSTPDRQLEIQNTKHHRQQSPV